MSHCVKMSKLSKQSLGIGDIPGPLVRVEWGFSSNGGEKSDVVRVAECEVCRSNVNTPAPRGQAHVCSALHQTKGACAPKMTRNAGYLRNGGTFGRSESIFVLGTIKIARARALEPVPGWSLQPSRRP